MLDNSLLPVRIGDVIQRGLVSVYIEDIVDDQVFYRLVPNEGPEQHRQLSFTSVSCQLEDDDEAILIRKGENEDGETEGYGGMGSAATGEM